MTERVRRALKRYEMEAAAAGKLADALEAVKQACLFADDDGTIGVTQDPHIHSELFDQICAALREAGRLKEESDHE